jgi:UDP-N-acetylglucosamine transferase subunit ALG13
MDRLLDLTKSFLEANENFNCVAQTGESKHLPINMHCIKWLTQEKFRHHYSKADIILSHAGMGNILLAAELEKPIVIMPRVAEYGEHVNNHQTGTLTGFSDRDFVFPAIDQESFSNAILDAQNWSPHNIDLQPRSSLVSSLKQYLSTD